MESYVVFHGFNSGIFPDARGCYNSLKESEGAKCYCYDSLSNAMVAFQTKDLAGGREITQAQLQEIINNEKTKPREWRDHNEDFI